MLLFPQAITLETRKGPVERALSEIEVLVMLR